MEDVAVTVGDGSSARVGSGSVGSGVFVQPTAIRIIRADMNRVIRMGDRLSAFARRIGWLVLSFTILWTAGACQTTNVPPAVAALPTLTTAATERPTLLTIPTQPRRNIFTPTSTRMPQTTTPPPLLVIDENAFAQAVERTSAPEGYGTVKIGESAGGRAITAQRFGAGKRSLILIGGIHGGWEGNTIELIEALIVHFETTPRDVHVGMTLILIPAANPDGMALGRTERGRFNANGVDLNRNWPCEWSREAYWRQQTVNPGIRAFSEPESLALANFILAERPDAVLFYHSAANGVFPGNCGGDHGSLAVASVVAEAAEYVCCEGFSAYPVTGTAATWADGEGIPAADVELTQSDTPEFERNLRAIIALQAWLTRNDDDL
ncbi:MAG: DUF2817 domain-containing protein [Anaerolineae bacterium]|nr:DUF2817 domain-containing protein [Anaerolineae bacterium]